MTKDYAFDSEAFFDDSLTVRRQGNFNYLAATHVYLLSVAGDDINWVGDPLDFNFRQLSDGRAWAHNAAFDGCYFLTRGLPFPGTSLDCSADLVAFLGSPRSLAGAAKHLLGKEVSKDLRDKMEGRPWHSLSADEQAAIRQYALRDSEIALELVTRYAGRWPADEMELSRHTREMGWHGVCVDCDKLDDFTERCQQICEEALPEIPWQGGDPDGDCYPLSLPRAREHCRALGITAPESFSEKSEACQQWETLYGAQYPFVAATRRYRKALFMQRKLEAMARRIMPDGRMNYSLRYAGAHTLRWAGDNGLNLQNLKKAPFHGMQIRELIIAPAGKKFIVVDLREIEPRCLAYLCGDKPLLEQLCAGANYYEAIARKWGVWDGPDETFKESAPELRATVKAQGLGCGYGVGHVRFRTAALADGRLMTPAEARRQVEFYRRHNPLVVQLWRRLDYALSMSVGAGEFRIELPSGRWLEYRNLRRAGGKVQCELATEKGYRVNTLWGGVLVENVTQSLARDAFAAKLLQLSRAGVPVVLHAHDEFVCEVDHDVSVEEIKDIVNQPVEWARDLPIASEGWEGPCYAKPDKP